MIEEVLSLKCQVSSRASQAGSLCGSPASNFTLHTSNSAEGRSRQTKPIGGSFKCRVSGVEKGKTVVWASNFTLYTSNSADGRLYKQTQLGGTPAAPCRPGPARTGCPNKPNSARSRRDSPYKQTQFSPAGWAGGVVAGAYRAKQTQFRGTGRSEGRLYKQSQLAGASHAKQTQFLPSCRSGDRRSQEGQSCQTKPIGGRSNVRQDLDTTRITAVSAAFPAVQNKANSRRNQVERSLGDGGRRLLYKQTQFEEV